MSEKSVVAFLQDSVGTPGGFQLKDSHLDTHLNDFSIVITVNESHTYGAGVKRPVF
jgi:hypothetical protein